MRNCIYKSKWLRCTVVVVIMLAFVLCFAACNEDNDAKDFENRLKNKGYDVRHVAVDNLDEYMEDEVPGAEWSVVGTIGDVWNGAEYEFVIVIKCNDESSAKAAETVLTVNAGSEGLTVKRDNDLIFLGTEKGVNDAL